VSASVVLMYVEPKLLGIKTNQDTLQLRKLNSIWTNYPDVSVVVSRDEMHGNRLYTVWMVRSKTGFAFFITPYKYVANLDSTGLVSIVISSQPCK